MKASDATRSRQAAIAAAIVVAFVLAPRTGIAAEPTAEEADKAPPPATEPAQGLNWKGEIENPRLTVEEWLSDPAGLPAPRRSEIERLAKQFADTEDSIKNLLQTMVNRGKIAFKRAQAHLDAVGAPPALSLDRWDELRRQRDAHQLSDSDYAAAIFRFHQLARDLQFRQRGLLAQVSSAVEDNTELPNDPVQPDTGRPQTPTRVVTPATEGGGQKVSTLPPIQIYNPPPASPFFQR